MSLQDGFPSASGLADANDVRLALAGLIIRDSSGNPRTGIFFRNTTALVTSTATMNSSVAAFEAAVSRSGQGVILLPNNGATNVLHDPAPVANSRYDTIYVKQNDAVSPNADANNLPVFGILKGTPSASPTLPTYATAQAALDAAPGIGAGAEPLTTVLIPSTATSMQSAGVVYTQLYQYTAAAGGIVPFRTKTELDLWTTAAEGQQARVLATDFTYRRVGAAWKNSVRGLALVRTLAFSSLATATLDGIFTSEFENYRLVIRLSGFSQTELSARLRSAGVTNSAATYDTTMHYGYVSASSSIPYAGLTLWNLIPSIAGGLVQLTIDISNPAVAAPTTIDSSSVAYNSGTGLTLKAGAGGGHRASTEFDGIAIVKPSGTMSGTIAVYGYGE